MQILAGTSGFSYGEWCGRFYPEALPAAQMLRFYSSRLPTVEINNTFYRMPSPELVAGWRDEVADSFCFAVKVPRRITHQKKLADVGEDVAHLLGVVDLLGGKLGPLLFQLPPFLKKDLGLLAAFLSQLPEGRRVALEFRHPSWFTDSVYSALSERNVALVAGDLDEVEKSPPLVATADFGYLRLRRPDYDADSLRDWGTRIAAQKWQTAYAYLKHEVLGPLLAEALLAHVSGREMADLSAVRAVIAAAESKPKSARSAPASSKKTEARASKVPAARASKTTAARSSRATPGEVSKTTAARVSPPPEAPVSKAPQARASKAPSKVRKP